jgi:hypothetical protein
MDLAMMSSTLRDGKLILDFPSQCPVLRKTQMMSIRRQTTTDHARLLSYKAYVIAIADAPRLRECQVALVD